MQHTNAELPHWDMNRIYPGLDSPEFQAGFEALGKAIARTVGLFDAHGIMLHAEPIPIDENTAEIFATTLNQLNSVSTQANLHRAYIASFISTNSRDTVAQMWMSKLQLIMTTFQKLMTRFTAWIGSLQDVEALIEQSAAARDHAFATREARIEAEHLMSPEEEALATELTLTGGRAWAKFYNNFSSQITADVTVAGETKMLPMTDIRNLAFDADRDVRRHAYEVELATWEANAMPIASALNSIKGQMNTLSKRRGWPSPLDIALFNNNIDRETLDAMLDTARGFFPIFRQYLRAKAGVFGARKLPWYDLFAPVGKSEQTWAFDTARDFIIEEFSAFSPRLGNLAKRAFEERWIDAEPRDGKRGGAFCMWVRDGESRILTNYKPAYGGMGTLAHELGHAYHNLARRHRTYIQRQTPMTLAETASNFCEILVREAALKTAPPQEQIVILEASLQDATQVVVDITSRFIFEQEVFPRREERELSADELNAIMLESQTATYGDGLDSAFLHPYMWAVKPHYYSSTFYNFPYMFGLLFSLGLYARYKADPDTFLSSYDDLLSATGMDDAATLAARFGIDIHSTDFWQGSLQLIAEDVVRFQDLV